MDAFGANELGRLLQHHEGPCVSIYLSTHPAGPQTQQDAVRLKNLLQQAEEKLADGWLRAPEARRVLASIRELPGDPAFWGARSDGLAIFVSPEATYRYRLPSEFDELMIVNRRFHVKPLLPLVSRGERYLVLTLSQNNVRLLTATRHSIETVDVPGLPANMEEALNYTSADRGSQTHSAMRGNLGKQAAVFHGQGGQADSQKDDLTQFFRLVDASLQPVLRDETAPMMLAGVDYLLPIYRQVCKYPHLAEPALEGNCDHLTPHQIHQQTWPLMERLFRRERDEAAAKFNQFAGTGKATGNIREIVPAACQGKVESLFVDLHALQWGRFDPQTTTLDLHDTPESGDDDMLDLAAVQTLLHRGAVYPVQRAGMPSNEPAAAVFRY